ncbi:MAG: hypothetical protein AAFU49_12960 [Pseudomonadota bacterium]
MTKDTDEQQTRMQAARESFSGKTMTETQIRQCLGIAGILNAEIHRSGSFKESLVDYAHAFARNEKFDAQRAEVMIRDIYGADNGETLNQTRERLMATEETLPEAARARALTCAETIGQLIEKPPTQPFYQAYDRAAVTLATELKITQTGAKALMKETFEAKHGKELYAHGKELEEVYHKPVREAEIAARKAEQLQTRSRSRSMS